MHLMPYTFNKKNLRSYSSRSIQVLRNTMDGATLLAVQESRRLRCQMQQVDCFQFLFYLYCDLENQISMEKRCLSFPKKLKCQKNRNYRQFATLSQLLSIFHFLHQSIAIAALTSRFIDSLMYCYNFILYPWSTTLNEFIRSMSDY